MVRKEFPQAVRVAAFERCSDGGKTGRCEKCGTQLKPGRYAFDHRIPAAMGGKATLDNCQVLCSGFARSCHAVKTTTDLSQIAKAKRLRAKHLSAKLSTGRTIGGSRKSPFKKCVNGHVERRAVLETEGYSL